jgi:tetratricopeptide (TPR) repeat protein
MERTTHWHAAYGRLLYEGREFSAAATEYQKAIDLDGNSWKGFQGLAKCLSKEKRYDESANRLREALSKAPTALKDAALSIQMDLIDILLSQKDFSAASLAARDAFENDRTEYDALLQYIKALYGVKDLAGIVSAIREFQDCQPAGKNIPRSGRLHSNMFRGVDDEVGRALRSQNELSMLQPSIKESLEPGPYALDFTLYPWLAAWIAEFMYSFYDDIDDSRKLFERLLSSKFRDNIRSDYRWAYQYPYTDATKYLGYIYYNKAVEAHISGTSPEEWVTKLRDMATTSDSSLDQEIVNAPLLGMYLRRYAGADQSEWRPCFQDLILDAVDVLADENSTYKPQTYVCLASSLLAAGDVSNATAAAAAVFIPYSVPDGSPAQAVLEKIDFHKDLYVCDGLCSTQFNTYKTEYRELYCCTECINTHFCEECYPLVKKCALPFRKCSADHEFVQLFPVPENAKDMAATFDGSQVKVSKEWLDDLREEWS